MKGGENMTDKDRIEVKCVKCGKAYTILYKNYKRGIKVGRQNICKACISDNSKDVRLNAIKKYFSDQKILKKHSKVCKDAWDKRPDDFKSQRLKDLKKIGDEYRNSVDFSKIVSERAKKYFSDPENRKKASESKKKWWDGLGDKEKARYMKHLEEYWDNASDDDIDSWFKNLLDGMILNNAISTGKTEEQFISDIQKFHQVN